MPDRVQVGDARQTGPTPRSRWPQRRLPPSLRITGNRPMLVKFPHCQTLTAPTLKHPAERSAPSRTAGSAPK